MTFLKGRVTDGSTAMPIEANITVADLTLGVNVAEANCDLNGEFLLAIPVKEKLLINVSSEGFVFHSDHMSFDSVRHQVAPFVKNITLAPIPEAVKEEITTTKPIVLNNIFFNSGEAILLPESMLEISYLFDLLKDRTDISMLITGHTDDIGSEEDNLALSNDRANAVKEALITLGIDAARIQAEGKGESEPIADNSTAEGRAMNRRTTFQLIR